MSTKRDAYCFRIACGLWLRKPRPFLVGGWWPIESENALRFWRVPQHLAYRSQSYSACRCKSWVWFHRTNKSTRWCDGDPQLFHVTCRSVICWRISLCALLWLQASNLWHPLRSLLRLTTLDSGTVSLTLVEYQLVPLCTSWLEVGEPLLADLLFSWLTIQWLRRPRTWSNCKYWALLYFWCRWGSATTFWEGQLRYSKPLQEWWYPLLSVELGKR